LLGQCDRTAVVDPDDDSPSVSDAATWQNMYQLYGAGVFPDPTFSMVPGSSVGTPQETIVDPRTMKVISIQEGFTGYYTALEKLASDNSG